MQTLLDRNYSKIRIAGGPGHEVKHRLDIIAMDFSFDQVVGQSLADVV